MKKDLLIVDAYNMIGNWPELNKMKQENRFEDARDALLTTLTEYRKYVEIDMIVVFDAMYVPGNAKSFHKYGMEIVWTSKDQTADSYIEALARRRADRFTQIIVATSDQAEQWTIFAAGALRIPAREFLGMINRAKQEVNDEAKKMTDQKNAIRHPWNTRQISELERLRDRLSHDH